MSDTESENECCDCCEINKPLLKQQRDIIGEFGRRIEMVWMLFHNSEKVLSELRETKDRIERRRIMAHEERNLLKKNVEVLLDGFEGQMANRNICVICRDEDNMMNSRNSKLFPCLHRIHIGECFAGITNNQCPICKGPMEIRY